MKKINYFNNFPVIVTPTKRKMEENTEVNSGVQTLISIFNSAKVSNLPEFGELENPAKQQRWSQRSGGHRPSHCHWNRSGRLLILFVCFDILILAEIASLSRQVNVK